MKTTQTYKIGDCLELIKMIPDNAIDLVILDPPYYKVEDAKWDNQWQSFEDYLNWIENIGIQLKRVLKNSGSLYLFGDDRNIAYVQIRYDKHFSFLNHLIWYKRNNNSIKGAVNGRRYVCVSERILFYGLQDSTGLSEIHDSKECFRPIKDYMNVECAKLRQEKGFKTKEELNQFLNELTSTASVVSRHYFYDSQWVFPTAEIYVKLQSTGYFQKEYEALRRPFNYCTGMYEVFDIPIINGSENTIHETTKPKSLIKQLILNSSNEGDSVLDMFLGSGTTLRACRETERNGIGFEINPDYEPVIKERSMANIPRLDTFAEA